MSVHRRSNSLSSTARVFFVGLLLGCGESTAVVRPDVVGTIAQIAITPAVSSIDVGDTVRLLAQQSDGDGRPVSRIAVVWESSDSSIVAVDTSGLARGLAGGVSTIYARASGVVGSATVTVFDKPSAPVATVQLSEHALTMKRLDASYQIYAHAVDSAGFYVHSRPPTWRSDDSTIVTVSQTGLLTARAVGSTSVAAIIEGIADSAIVHVDTVVTGEARATFTSFGSQNSSGIFGHEGCATQDTLTLVLAYEEGAVHAKTTKIRFLCTTQVTWFSSNHYPYTIPAEDVLVEWPDAVNFRARLPTPGGYGALTLVGNLPSGGVASLARSSLPSGESSLSGTWMTLPP